MPRDQTTQALIRLWRSREQAAKVAFVNVQVRPGGRTTAHQVHVEHEVPTAAVSLSPPTTRRSPDFNNAIDLRADFASPVVPVIEPVPEGEADFFGNAPAPDRPSNKSVEKDEGFDEGVVDGELPETRGVAAAPLDARRQSAGEVPGGNEPGVVESSVGFPVVAGFAWPLIRSPSVDGNSAQLDTENECDRRRRNSTDASSVEVLTEVAEPARETSGLSLPGLGSGSASASRDELSVHVQRVEETSDVEALCPPLLIPATLHSEGPEATSAGDGLSIDYVCSTLVQGQGPTEDLRARVPSDSGETKKPASGFRALVLRRLGSRRDRERKSRAARPVSAPKQTFRVTAASAELAADATANAAGAHTVCAGDVRPRASEAPESRRRSGSSEDARVRRGPESSGRTGARGGRRRYGDWRDLVTRLREREPRADAATPSERGDREEKAVPSWCAAGERRRKPSKLRRKQWRPKQPGDAGGLRKPNGSKQTKTKRWTLADIAAATSGVLRIWAGAR